MPNPAHILKSITDQAGNLVQQSTVRVYEPGTTTLVSDPFYSDRGLAQQLGNPYLCLSGVIDIYFAAPRRVRIGVTPPTPSAQEIIFEDIDTTEPPSGAEAQVVYNQAVLDETTAYPQRTNLKFGTGMTVTDDPTDDATMIVAAVPDFSPTADPILLGNGALDTGPSSPTLGGIAIGDSAKIGDGNAVAVGAGANSDDASAVAIGDQAAVGSATGDSGVAIGHLATVLADRGVAIGNAAGASGASATAVGDNSTAASAHSTAVGADAATTEANQVMLGTSADFAEVPGNGIVLHSPNGTRFRVTVDDTGHLTTTQL